MDEIAGEGEATVGDQIAEDGIEETGGDQTPPKRKSFSD